MKYVNVAIDNSSDNTDVLYTYGCEFDEVQIGNKVKVPFGKGNKLKDAYVFEVFDELTESVRGLKYVESIDEEVSLTAEMMETCLWMRKRYLCRYIDAIGCFTPSGSKAKTRGKKVPYSDVDFGRDDDKDLTEEQTDALNFIKESIEQRKHDIFLIHGVTGSGKTELYIRLIREVLDKGRNAIVLVPEISLTTQVIERFMKRFGKEHVAVLHSKLSLGERYDEWVRIRTGNVRIVIGARSAIFAPLENVGIVVMDEEHESTYKSDMTPKYETVEVATKRAKNFDGIVVLGSATPSMISKYRADKGIYKRVELKKRYNSMPLPKVEIVDMREELKQGNKTIFSRSLVNQMQDALEKGQQVILFLNRRGYSTFVSCRECGHVLKCPECGISLTYHKRENGAACHYCGRILPVPRNCPECNSKNIKYFGSGTEKVEEFVGEIFPQYKTARLDLDTVKSKGSIDKILNSFKKGKTQILIGTQLVAKGLDFKNVAVVGIISADVILNIPDYRAAERSFQLITQAAGRAGRGEERGKVVIQTYEPEHYSVMAAAEQDYEKFSRTEMIIRETMSYPPFSDLIQMVIIAKQEQVAEMAAHKIRQDLQIMLGQEMAHNIYQPQALLSNHLKEHYRQGIIIKCPKEMRGKCLGAASVLKQKINTDAKQQFTLMVDINPY